MTSHTPPPPSATASHYPIGPLALQAHPATPGPAGLSVSVRLSVGNSAVAPSLLLEYHLQGPLEQLRLPAPQPPGMADGLWQHTCLEAFVSTVGETAYREFNFSPSGQWAAYRFSGERLRDAAAEATGTLPSLQVRCRSDAHKLWLAVELPASALPLNSATALQIGLSAVLEDQQGQLSYWALQHPTAGPDFHHRSGFSLRAPHPFSPTPARASTA
ncbi:DOMON-like domain-containing protein [Hydrogenophaga sp.]|uniref:DOMON-like domain-containing protein n=1 Tax=Hydrogenophaga sp. TaxID=1904254 RepID=UPI00356A3496